MVQAYTERASIDPGRTCCFGLGSDFADLFSARGWNLYEASGPIESMDQMEEVVRGGRAWPARPNQRYILLPRVSMPTSPLQVFSALESNAARYPFFLDEGMQEVNGEPVMVRRGMYLIDSVLMTSEHVLILVDADAMLMLDIPIPKEFAGMDIPCVAFDIFDMYDRIGQVSRPFRHSAMAA